MSTNSNIIVILYKYAYRLWESDLRNYRSIIRVLLNYFSFRKFEKVDNKYLLFKVLMKYYNISWFICDL
jgi:hypothetical protein